MDAEEKAAWGWLGRPPQSIVDASQGIVRQWKEMEREAYKVARMKRGSRKTDAAKDIEYRRAALIQMAENEQNER